MNDYYKVRVEMRPCNEDATDLAAALLADAGYESFVADATGLDAYVRAEDYSAEALSEALADFPFDCSLTTTAEFVEGRDWNAEWEKNYFQPIVVDGRCVIHGSFHTDIPAADYDIVIDPKMAFGTGHHDTTSQIIAALLDMDLAGKAVTDMGTGTGILAILAAMRGASPVSAVEIDAFAYENAVENVASNGHPEIKIVHGDASALADLPKADVFIANINRNIIVADLPRYAAAMAAGATVIFSGFYLSDVPIVEKAAAGCGIVAVSTTSSPAGWACVTMKKN